MLRQCSPTTRTNAKAHETLGLVELRRGRWPRQRWRREALRSNARPAARLEQPRRRPLPARRPGGALDAWQRAVELDPELWDALWNLGTRPRSGLGAGREGPARFAERAPRDRYGPDVERARGMLAQLRRLRGR